MRRVGTKENRSGAQLQEEATPHIETDENVLFGIRLFQLDHAEGMRLTHSSSSKPSDRQSKRSPIPARHCEGRHEVSSLNRFRRTKSTPTRHGEERATSVSCPASFSCLFVLQLNEKSMALDSVRPVGIYAPVV
mmetsp:Transcript_25800/g.60753  ORF Transcript_25800/g.60753 Transcript_25800/m.60753 type:complete len:134 (-) Transcript_25800:43-444(-)